MPKLNIETVTDPVFFGFKDDEGKWWARLEGDKGITWLSVEDKETSVMTAMKEEFAKELEAQFIAGKARVLTILKQRDLQDQIMETLGSLFPFKEKKDV